MPPTNDSAVDASVARVQELPMFGFSAGSCSMTGDYREGNEDSLYVSRWSVFVADGVGGLAAGEVASSTVTHRIGAVLENTHGKVTSAERLHEILAEANVDLARRALREPALKGMATTFTGAFSDGAIIRVAHVGDSRAYRLREGRLTQATRDDSYIQDLIDAGTLTVDAARTHPFRSVVTNVLSGDDQDAAAINIVDEIPHLGDRWLVTSDGLTDYVPMRTIHRILAARAHPQATAEMLVQAAKENRTRDNVSVIVADVISLLGSPPHDPVFGGSAAAGVTASAYSG